jgi:hypothetical protein
MALYAGFGTIYRSYQNKIALCFMKRYFYRFAQFDENINSLQLLNLLSANQNAKLYLFV